MDPGRALGEGRDALGDLTILLGTAIAVPVGFVLTTASLVVIADLVSGQPAMERRPADR